MKQKLRVALRYLNRVEMEYEIETQFSVKDGMIVLEEVFQREGCITSFLDAQNRQRIVRKLDEVYFSEEVRK